MAEPKQIAVEFPQLRPADRKIADPGKVRLGDSCISGQFPPLHRPDATIADPGNVRLGDSCITGRFPSAK
jgi:hypothetical protein